MHSLQRRFYEIISRFPTPIHLVVINKLSYEFQPRGYYGRQIRAAGRSHCRLILFIVATARENSRWMQRRNHC